MNEGEKRKAAVDVLRQALDNVREYATENWPEIGFWIGAAPTDQAGYNGVYLNDDWAGGRFDYISGSRERFGAHDIDAFLDKIALHRIP